MTIVFCGLIRWAVVSIRCRFVASVVFVSIGPKWILTVCAFQFPGKWTMKNEIKKKKMCVLLLKMQRNITKMVSIFTLLWSLIIKSSGIPSKSSKCVRIRFSSQCFAKWTPSTEYQCSSSTGDWIATQVFIWFSMNANRAVLFHEVVILCKI